jgi:hypothetical protein
MGTITRSFANNITTSGVLLPASLNNNSISNVTEYNVAIATGNMVLISSQTASNSASLSFTTGIDSTYKEYQFWFINIAPRTDGIQFQFNLSTDAGSNYNVTKTSSAFLAYHNETDTDNVFASRTSDALEQSTGYQIFTWSLSNDADRSNAGTLSLFNPASTTYVKHYICNTNSCFKTGGGEKYIGNMYIAGYGNTTTAINAIRFQMTSGNFDGTRLMYGIK